MKRKSTSAYTADWPQVALHVKDEAGWKCIRCDHPHDPKAGYTLTVHHLDLSPANNRWWNVLALCQRCHLSVQGRVILERPWVFEHTEWFRPFVAGYYASRYLGQELTRSEVNGRLDELLQLERQAVLG